MDTFASRLKLARTRVAMTQEALAKASGVSRVKISGYETSKSLPSSSTVARLSSALNVRAVWLATGIGNEAPEDQSGLTPPSLAMSPNEGSYRRLEIFLPESLFQSVDDTARCRSETVSKTVEEILGIFFDFFIPELTNLAKSEPGARAFPDQYLEKIRPRLEKHIRKREKEGLSRNAAITEFMSLLKFEPEATDTALADPDDNAKT